MVIAANAPISGSFEAPSINLANQNGEITANVSVVNEKNSNNPYFWRSVRLSSTNRYVPPRCPYPSPTQPPAARSRRTSRSFRAGTMPG